MKKSKKITALMAALSVFGLTGCDLGSISDSIKNFDVWNLVDPLHWFHDKKDKDQDQDKDDDKDVAVTSVVVTPSTLSLKEGESRLLSVEVLPSNATNKTVTWTSTNPEVATVSNGNVVAVKEGSVTIKATADGKEGQCVVTVTKDGEDTPPAPVEIDHIEIVGSLTKTSYKVGEAFSSEGLSVKAVKTDGTESVVSGSYEFTPAIASKGMTKVSVIARYSDNFVSQAKEFNITVTEEEQGTNYGTEQAPLTVTQALAIITDECKEDKAMTAQEITVQGQITEIKNTFTYESGPCFEFNISDGTSTVYVYRCHCTDQQATGVVVGATVKLVGYAKNFKGTLEFVDNGASQCHILSIEGDTPDKELVSISIEGSLTKTEYVVGQTYSAAGLSVKGHYDDGTEGVVPASITLNKTTAVLGDTEIIASATYNGKTAEPKTFTISVVEGQVKNYGTEQAPLTVSQALALITEECTEDKAMTAQEITVQGQITEIKNTFTYESGPCFEFNISDGTSTVYVYRCHCTDQQATGVVVGATVKLVGYAKNFKGTLEFVDNGASQCHILSIEGDTPDKELVSISIEGTLTKTEYVEGQTYSSAGLSVKGHYDDGSEGVVAATITLNKTTAALGDTEIIASATFKEITAEPKTFTVTVTEKVPVVGGSVYTFKNDKTSSQNMKDWTSEQFMKCVEVDGGEIITGMKDVTNAYIGGNGGKGDTAWNLWDCLKIGKSEAKGEITLLLDGTVNFSKIKVSAIGARDDGTLTINEITQNVTKKATKDDLEPIELEYEITGGITELKLSSKDAASNNYGIVITRIEFVGGETPNPDPVLSSLVLTQSPTKTEYFAGQEFNAEGMVITAKYTNGGSDKVLQPGEYTIDKTTLAIGDTFVTVSYTDGEVTKTIQVPVTVTKAPVPVTGITLNKTAISMHVLDADIQLTATVTPDDADDKTVVWTVSENGIVTVENGLVHAVAAGEVVVTATAGDFSATCTVTVGAAEKVISGISIANMPSKTTYVEGETFNPEGMAITITYSSAHEPETVTSGFTYEQGALTLGKNAVEIDYNGFKTNVSITVTPAPVLDSISVANAQGKTNTYTAGDKISKDDLVVTAHYTQGKQDAVVTDYTISLTEALTVSDSSATITYVEGGVEKTAVYSFTVNPNTHINSVKTAYEAILANPSSTDVYEFEGVVVGTKGNSFYVQDGDYGILVYNKAVSGNQVGKQVKVQSTLKIYNGMVETNSVTSASIVTDGDMVMPSAKTVSNATELSNTNQNTLINVSNLEVVSKESSWASGTTNNWKIKIDGTETTLSLDKYAFNQTNKDVLSSLNVGDQFTITNAVVGYYNAAQIAITSESVVAEVVSPVTSIALGGDMAKKEYHVGDSWDYAGITCSAEFENGSSKQLSFDSLTITSLSSSAPAIGVSSLTINVKVTAYPEITGSITINGLSCTEKSANDPVDLTKTVASIATTNSWTNGTKYTSFELDSVISVSCTGGDNTGKYYSSDNSWRIYAGESGTVTISASAGYTIEKVAITYTVKDNGVVKVNDSDVKSDEENTVNASSFIFSAGSSSGNKGKVFITSIHVVYVAE